MNPEIYQHSLWLCILPEDLEIVKKGLKAEKLYSYLSGYDVGLSGFKMTWAISSKKFEPTVLAYNWTVMNEGPWSGFYFLRFSWAGPRDASHIIDFKKKYELGLHQFSTSADWLAEPVCIVFSNKTKEYCQNVLNSIKREG